MAIIIKQKETKIAIFLLYNGNENDGKTDHSVWHEDLLVESIFRGIQCTYIPWGKKNKRERENNSEKRYSKWSPQHILPTITLYVMLRHTQTLHQLFLLMMLLLLIGAHIDWVRSRTTGSFLQTYYWIFQCKPEAADKCRNQKRGEGRGDFNIYSNCFPCKIAIIKQHNCK